MVRLSRERDREAPARQSRPDGSAPRPAGKPEEDPRMTFTVARNERTSLYEVHLAGCRHLIAAHLDVMAGEYEAATGAAVKAEFDADNEDCVAKLGPCAKAPKGAK